MASRFTKWPEERADADRADAVVAQWKDYATLASSGDLPDARFPLVPVYFDRFIGSRAYRSDIAGAMGIRDGDTGLDQVTSYGHGSSFSGTGRLDPRDVLDRWSRHAGDPAFARLFADGTVMALAEQEGAPSLRPDGSRDPGITGAAGMQAEG